MAGHTNPAAVSCSASSQRREVRRHRDTTSISTQLNSTSVREAEGTVRLLLLLPTPVDSGSREGGLDVTGRMGMLYIYISKQRELRGSIDASKNHEVGRLMFSDVPKRACAKRSLL